jgi:flagellar hook assembly protein FlgD
VKITAYDQTGTVQDSFFLFPRTQGRSVKATASYPIAYEVPKPKSRDFGVVHVTLLLRDRSGNLLRVLKDTDEGPGSQIYQWDGLDGTGHQVPSGTYFVETATGDKIKTTKITVGGGATPSTQPATTTSTTVSTARRVTISYEVPKPPAGQDKTKVVLLIVDASGSPLRKLIDGEQVPGKHSLSWDGLDEKGTALPSGTYEYELRAGEKMLRKKVELK